MISQAVEYSLRAMALLSHSAGQPLTVQALAERGQIPGPYLSKLLQRLARAGLIQSQRGVGGGYTLTRDPASISLADVVNVVEPIRRITECPLGIQGHTRLCRLHRTLDQALAVVEQSLRDTSLADLFQDTEGSMPLCREQSVLPLPPRLQPTDIRPIQ